MLVKLTPGCRSNETVLKVEYYLRLQVSVDNALSVHEVDDGNELPHVLGRLGLAEPLLCPDSLQELAAPQVLSHDVGVNLILKKQKNKNKNNF